MNPPHEAWERLVAAARRAPADARAVDAPPGFATRVVAHAMARAGERSLSRLVERFSLRALGLAGGLAAASVVINFAPARQAFAPDLLAEQDPVAVVVDLS